MSYPQYQLDQYVAGALDAELAEQIKRDAASDPELAQTIADLQLARERFLARKPEFDMDAARAAASRRRRQFFSAFGVAVSVACAALFMISRVPKQVTQPPPPYGVKGSGGNGAQVALEIRRADVGWQPLKAFEVRQGDTLRVQVTPPKGSQHVGLAALESGKLSKVLEHALKRQGTQYLPRLLDVDESTADETLIVLFSPGPIDWAKLEQADQTTVTKQPKSFGLLGANTFVLKKQAAP